MSAMEFVAPPDWRTVDFISDVHLHANEPQTFSAWKHYMDSTAADAVFILGDLFEVWVGDDVLGEHDFEDQCAQVIKKTAKRIPIFFMHGNRDFLVSNALMVACQTTLLADPAVLVFNQNRWLLSHGDALCTSDLDYMHFRKLVRSKSWQQAFLAKPLAERQILARNMRLQSEAKKQSGTEYADVDDNAAAQLLKMADCSTLIHGHTHKPATHTLEHGLQRVVLSDWDAAARPPRAEVLRLSTLGLQRINLL